MTQTMGVGKLHEDAEGLGVEQVRGALPELFAPVELDGLVTVHTSASAEFA